MSKYYVAAKCNPVDFLRGKAAPLETIQPIGVCANLSDAIDYLDAAVLPSRREDAMFRDLQLPMVELIFTVQPRTNEVFAVPGASWDTTSQFLQHVNIHAVDVKIPPNGMFTEATYHVSSERIDDYVKLVSNDIWARATITHEILDACKSYTQVPDDTIVQWYREMMQNMLSPISLISLPTIQWTELLAKTHADMVQNYPNADSLYIGVVSRLKTTAQLQQTASTIAEHAILESMEKTQRYEHEILWHQMLKHNLTPEKYLQALLPMVPSEDQRGFQMQYQAMVSKYQHDNPVEPVQNAALFAGASVAQTMAFLYRHLENDEYQACFDEICKKCEQDLHEWQNYEQDEENISFD